jgi:MoxR-like ATPase
MPLFAWSVSRGLTKFPSHHALFASTNAPLQALRHIEDLKVEGIFLLLDFARYLQDPALARQLRDVLQNFSKTRSCIVLAGDQIQLPSEIHPSVVFLDLPLPDKEEIGEVVDASLRSLQRNHAFTIDITDREKSRLLDALSGLTLNQARQRIASAVLEDGVLNAADIAGVQQQKARLIRESGLLEFFPAADNRNELGGFANLKAWLDRAALGFSEEAKALNLAPPRGILMVGVQGCGKSLAAKAIAARWQLPLLKLDAGSLYDKYIGESEKNFRKAVRLTEAVAPAVLWIDEMEKAFASGGGTSMRILASFLTWLQEKQETVFVVGTANNIDALPPELLRKGRFDEVFFVDLPDAGERTHILRIHLALRNQDPAAFDLIQLARATEGFSGAEIEQALVSGLYRALAAKRPLDDHLILREIEETVPLSVSRREDITRLREYARNRFVSAHRPPSRPATPPHPGTAVPETA